MLQAPIPNNEALRLCAVQGLHILDTQTEERFDRITRAAIERFEVPISTIALIDKSREWFKSAQGTSIREGPRDISFCGHALVSEAVLIVEDAAADARFADNPMVNTAAGIRFYAGKALYEAHSRLPVGVFCIKDRKPRTMSLDDIADFLELAKQAEEEVNRAA